MKGIIEEIYVPTLHLNGSGAEALLKQHVEAVQAINQGLEALNNVTPNGRDYYPQGKDAFGTALKQHKDRVLRLVSVRDELQWIVERISDVIDDAYDASMRR